MIELSRQAAWEQMASYRFVQDTTDVVAAAEFLSRMADAKDAEGTSLGFMRLTMTCTNCHRHVRTDSVAVEGPLVDVVRNSAEHLASVVAGKTLRSRADRHAELPVSTYPGGLMNAAFLLRDNF